MPDPEKLARRDLRVHDVRDWREGDHLVVEFDFGVQLQALPIETLRVGLYHFSDETNTMAGGIDALDEQGRPVKAAIDIPHEAGCVTG